MSSIFGAFLCVLFLSPCGGSTHPDEPPISGIVRTAEDGRILEEDLLDWLPRMRLQSGGGIPAPDTTFAFSPAFPNPATSNVTSGCAVIQRAHVRAWVVDRDGETVVVLRDDMFEAGTHMFAWDLKNGSGNDVAAGLFRVYFEITHGSDAKTVRSFGDVVVE